MKKLFTIFLIFLFLFCGCVGKKEKIVRYVCPAGSIVKNPTECKIETTTATTSSISTTLVEEELGTTTITTTTLFVLCDTKVKFCLGNRCSEQLAYGICTPKEIEKYLKEKGLKGCKEDSDCIMIQESIESITTLTTLEVEELGITTFSTSITTTTKRTLLGITTTSTSTTIIQESEPCVELGCPSGTKFVGSKNSDKYHYCSCRYAKKIKKENLICFESKKEAQNEGYIPCGVCKPPS
jgi:hypothetical protein